MQLLLTSLCRGIQDLPLLLTAGITNPVIYMLDNRSIFHFNSPLPIHGEKFPMALPKGVSPVQVGTECPQWAEGLYKQDNFSLWQLAAFLPLNSSLLWQPGSAGLEVRFFYYLPQILDDETFSLFPDSVFIEIVFFFPLSLTREQFVLNWVLFFPNGRLLASDKLGSSMGIWICSIMKVKLYQLHIILQKTVHVPEQREYDKALEVFSRFERLYNSERWWTVGSIYMCPVNHKLLQIRV